jgi:hypothetical protein
MKRREDPKMMAQRMARYMGCSGVHQNENGVWMPCSSPEELNKISDAAEPEKKSFQKEPLPKRKKRGKRSTGWEKLRERGILGIDTLPGGGLVSAGVGKAVNPCWPGYVMVGMKPGKNGRMVPNCVPVDSPAKSDVVYGRAKPRLGDFDVFQDANSARERSRSLGCIGIARRQTPEGEWVWTPCSNVSDYRRRTGRGVQASQDKRREERRFMRRLREGLRRSF